MSIPAPVIAVGKEIALSILGSEGVKAWDKLRGTPSAQDLQAETIGTLRQVIQEEVYRARLGQALSHHANASREVGYYRNDPSHYRQALGNARTESGFAMSELDIDGLGLRSFPSWIIAAELHCCVLQEEFKVSRSPGTLQAMRDHVGYIDRTAARVATMITSRNPLPPISTGTINIVIPPNDVQDAGTAIDLSNEVRKQLHASLAFMQLMQGQVAIRTWAGKWVSANNVAPWQLHQVDHREAGEKFTVNHVRGQSFELVAWTGRRVSANNVHPWQIHQMPNGGDGETFTFVPVSPNRWKIRCWTGKFISANNAPPWQLHQVDHAEAGETFEVVNV